ncbi:MAG: DNA polymerase III subunit gamma/tau [Bacillota bacterium]|jgi:DNA polymerase-3 subunit gamma/tau|nr:DNA polymerase III subunit gamma/tau [Bacillota bacterium]
MHQALYRSFRPETFDGILGQEHIVKILSNQIRSGTTGHAYLFCGTRGTGKTTTARILAKGVNCTAPQEDRPCGVCENCIAIRDGVFLDVIEIDAASNNGVDNIRELRESVKYPPAAGRCKVYIIDEVHMLTSGAFNALLKTLEEPPTYVLFILATTEPQKLPATILSRCLRLDFHRVPEKLLREGMREICESLGVKISDSALGIIAANGDGSVRDSLSILDQCIAAAGKEVARQDVLDVLGTSGEEVFIQLTDMVDQGRAADALLLLDRILSEGKEVRQLMKDWIAHYRSLMLTKFIRNPEDMLNVSEENVERIREQSTRIPMSSINDSILDLARTLSEAKWSTQPRILLELCILRLASGGNFGNLSADSVLQDKNMIAVKKTEEKKEEFEAAERQPAMTDTVPDVVQVSDIDMDAEQVAGTDVDVGQVPDAGIDAGQVADTGIDVEKIWDKVLEEGESQKTTFNVLRRGARLVAIEENCFRLEVGNEVTLRYAKGNADYISQLLEKYTGRALKMDCVLVNQDRRAQEEKSAEELAYELGNCLNINIEVK